VNAARDGAMAIALVNVLASVGLGLIGVWAGRVVAHAVWG
jgi:fluoride ion exporter CrcB/FEX